MADYYVLCIYYIYIPKSNIMECDLVLMDMCARRFLFYFYTFEMKNRSEQECWECLSTDYLNIGITIVLNSMLKAFTYHLVIYRVGYVRAKSNSILTKIIHSFILKWRVYIYYMNEMANIEQEHTRTPIRTTIQTFRKTHPVHITQFSGMESIIQCEHCTRTFVRTPYTFDACNGKTNAQTAVVWLLHTKYLVLLQIETLNIRIN